MSAQWPLVAARLLALLPTLPGWSTVVVFDGPPVTGEVVTDFASVGWVDGEQAGSYTTVLHLDGVNYAETGTVRCLLSCNTGDTGAPDVGGMAPMRSRVFPLADAVEASVRADRRLGGVLSPEGYVEFAVEVLSDQTEAGAAQSLVLTFTYFTVT